MPRLLSRSYLFWVVFLHVSLFVVSASADELTTARNQPLRETSHQVDVRIKDGVATYRVRRTFENRGKVAEEARLTIELPHGAVATGLRIFAGGRWHEGDLMHRDKAESLYRELTGMGPSRPKDPALLYWNWTSELGLRLFPIFPTSKSLVEYTLTVPTNYEGGEYFMSYPRRHEDSRLATPRLTVQTGKLMTVDGERANENSLELGPVPVHPLLANLERGDQRTLVRPLSFPNESKKNAIAVFVDIQHTWVGDLDLEVVDPEGQVHLLSRYDFARNENELKKRFVVPHTGKKKGIWHLLIRDHHPLDGGHLRSWTLTPIDRKSASGSSIEGVHTRGIAGVTATDKTFASIPQPNPSQGNIATLSVRLQKKPATKFRLGRLEFSGVPNFARVEVDVAERLSSLPHDHRVVFIVDTSHTMGEDGIRAQLRLTEAYLAHVPDARFALVGSARRAVLLAPFSPAKSWKSVVARLRKKGALSPKNGSFLDRGLTKAASLLPTTKGSSKIVAFTDDRLRPVWSNSAALSAIESLPPQTIVHVAHVNHGGSVALIRNDDHRLFPLAKKRGGVAVVSSGARLGKQTLLENEALYLVRPNRLDHVRFSALSEEISGVGPSLGEGESVRWMSQVKSIPGELHLRGQLWSRDLVLTPETTEDFHRATAGFVFSLDHYWDLSELQQYLLATYARAVSPVTSYLAIEPGVRPSTIGLEKAGSGLGFGSGMGMGGFGLSGTSRPPSLDWKSIVAQVEDACASRRTNRSSVVIRVDRNDHEVADVRLDDQATPYLTCAVEELWKVQLPVGLSGDETKELLL